MTRETRLIIRAFAAAISVGLFAWLAAENLAPSGRMTVSTSLDQPAPYVSDPKPFDRLGRATDTDGRSAVPLLAEPIFLDVSPPSPFDRAKVSVTFKPGRTALMAGGLTSVPDNTFEMKSLYSPLIDSLGWYRVASGNLTLFEREEEYASVEEFLSHPPDVSRVAVWGAGDGLTGGVEGYRLAEAMTDAQVSLRGAHRLLAYTGGEPLEFNMTVQDMNRAAGPDPVVLAVFKPGDREPLAKSELADDGDVSADQRSSKLRNVSVSLSGLAAGTYEVVFSTTPDVFVRRLVTRQSRFVFVGRLYLGDHVGYSDVTPPLTVFVSAKSVRLRIAHPESYQEIKVNGSPITLDDASSTRTVELPTGLSSVNTAKRDVLLEAEGYFALSRGYWFDPGPFRIDGLTGIADLDDRNVDFVLAAYSPPERDGGFLTVESDFALDDLARRDDGSYRFAISAPGLVSGADPPAIESISFQLSRSGLSWASLLTRFAGGTSGQAIRVSPSGYALEDRPE